jgi:hypothetical protein
VEQYDSLALKIGEGLIYGTIPTMADDRPQWRIEYGRIRKLGGGDYWKGERLEDEAARSTMSPYALGAADRQSWRDAKEMNAARRPIACPFADGTPEKAEYDRGWDSLPLKG